MTIYECRKCGHWETSIMDLDIHQVEIHELKRGDLFTFGVPYSKEQHDIRERKVKNMPKGGGRHSYQD